MSQGRPRPTKEAAAGPEPLPQVGSPGLRPRPHKPSGGGGEEEGSWQSLLCPPGHRDATFNCHQLSGLKLHKPGWGPGIPMDTGSSPDSSTSDPASYKCAWEGNGGCPSTRETKYVWEIQKLLLAPGFGPAAAAIPEVTLTEAKRQRPGIPRCQTPGASASALSFLACPGSLAPPSRSWPASLPPPSSTKVP